MKNSLIVNPDSGKILDTPPPDVAEIDTSAEGPKRIGFSLFILVFLVFGSWATIAPLDGAANASGSVTVRSYKKAVQHFEGGIVSAIHVRDGDQVISGEPLLEIDRTQPLAQLEITTSNLIAARTKEARLMAERDYEDAIVFPSDLQGPNSTIDGEIEAQRQIFRARNAARLGSIEVLNQRVEQLESQIGGFEALKSARLELAESYQEELEDVEALLNQGFSDITRVRELARNVANNTAGAAELTANISTSRIQIGETQLQILQLDHEFINEVVETLGETQTIVRDLNEQRTVLQDIVDRTTIRAPVAGGVNGMQVHTIGGVISPGTPIAEIIPQSDELIIEARVSPLDIDRVSEGQEAKIRFSSFWSSVPTIFGEVISISGDSFTDENSGTNYYLARIDVYPESIGNLDGLALIPGMPADVFISTGARTFLQYLFKPFSNALARSFNED